MNKPHIWYNINFKCWVCGTVPDYFVNNRIGYGSTPKQAYDNFIYCGFIWRG